METTPSFVRWALEYRCSLREELSDWRSPEQVERQLRALSAIRDAHRDHRVVDGICLQQPAREVNVKNAETLGFRVEEIISGYGPTGNTLPCGQCPANTALPAEPMSDLAGCYGWLIVDATLMSQVDELADSVETDRQAVGFPTTRPGWYSLWMPGRLDGEPLDYHAELFDKLRSLGSRNFDGLGKYCSALELARSHQLGVAVEFVPPGRLEGDQWILPPHCNNCRAARDVLSAHCPVCGQTGKPFPEQKRHAKGNRPYWELSRFLGKDGARELLRHYQTIGRA